MRKWRHVVAIVALVFSIVGCSKDETNPVIDILSPMDGDTYSAGDTIAVLTYFSDNEDLATYDVKIGDFYEASINGFPDVEYGFINGMSYTYTQYMVVPEVQSLLTFYLYFTAKDVEGNVTTKYITLNYEAP
ncbi:MAG: hypothetical protein HRT71_04815 [Flavobacteriales bacterium]|nr:hypothetical protein [Flavobacteriales bacterium]